MNFLLNNLAATPKYSGQHVKLLNLLLNSESDYQRVNSDSFSESGG